MTTVEIEWIDSISPAATGNKIYRDDVEIADIDNGIQIYQDDTALEGTTYKYEVQAHDGSGDETTQEVTGVNTDTITTADAPSNPELLTNGDFSNGSTDWTLLTGATLNVDEVAISTTSTYANMLTQSGVNLVNGSTYTVGGTIRNYAGGQIRIYLGSNQYSIPRADGDFSADLVQNSADGIFSVRTGGDATTTLTIDNLTCKLAT